MSGARTATAGAARDRRGLHRHQRAGGQPGPGRTPQPGRVAGHDPQRHGRLEDEGLIAQPHTSAGRVPTDAGYRRFVDELTDLKPLISAEKRAIRMFLDDAVDLDDVLHRAVRSLAQLTRNVAVVQYPSLSRSRIRHVELVVGVQRRG